MMVAALPGTRATSHRSTLRIIYRAQRFGGFGRVSVRVGVGLELGLGLGVACTTLVHLRKCLVAQANLRQHVTACSLKKFSNRVVVIQLRFTDLLYLPPPHASLLLF